MSFLVDGMKAVRVVSGNTIVDGVITHIDFEKGVVIRCSCGHAPEAIEGAVSLLVDLHLCEPLSSYANVSDNRQA